MENEDADLKSSYNGSVFREGLGRENGGDECPRKNEIDLFFDPDTPRRAKLAAVDHLTSCPGCARYFSFLLELDRKQNEFSEAVAGRLREPPAADEGGPSPAVRIGPWFLIPVLGLVLVAAISLVLMVGHIDKGPDTPRASGKQFNLIGPQGEVGAGEIVFRWERHPQAESYIIEICDQSLKPVWKSDTILGTEYVLPKPVGDMLAEGGPYLWSVAAYSSEVIIAESGVLKLSIRPDPGPTPDQRRRPGRR